MLYALAEKRFPTYYKASYRGAYRRLDRTYHRLSRDPITALHYHDCMELGICLKGSGVNYVENRRYDYRAGDLQVVPAGLPHLSKAGEEETEWLWISLDPLRVLSDGGFHREETVRVLIAKSFAGLFHPWEHPSLAALITRLRFVPEETDGEGDVEIVFLVGQLLVECARIGSAERRDLLPPSHSSSRIQPALDYIREHFSDREAMREECIAKVCKMSSSHFRAVFKRETGIGVRNCIIQTRLATAAHLLESTERSVLQIALDTGFGQISHFNRVFLKVFGQTPTGFRRRFREQEGEN